MLDVVETIRRFNADREPERLAMKYANMRESPFVFLRGTCHLFYDRLSSVALPAGAPSAWVCGESPRFLWRLQLLRRWSYEQVEEVLT